MKNWLKALALWFNIRVFGESLVMMVGDDPEIDLRYRYICASKGKVYYTSYRNRMVEFCESGNDVKFSGLSRSCFSGYQNSLLKNLKAMFDYDERHDVKHHITVTVSSFLKYKVAIC